MLTRAKILAKTDLPRRTIRVPEWADENGDDEVMIRVLKASERDGYELWRAEAIAKHKDGEPIAVRARFVSLAVCDERGEPLFTEDDAIMLGDRSGVALDRVYSAILAHNGMDSESQEEVRKNSKAPPAGAGCTERPAS